MSTGPDATPGETTPRPARGLTPRERREHRERRERRHGTVVATYTMPAPRCASCGGNTLGGPAPDRDGDRP